MKFTLFKFPVRVDLTFCLILFILLQSDLDARAYDLFALKGLVIFASILIHELGHALTFRKFGVHSSIELYSLGGLCRPLNHAPLTHLQHMLVSLAGPLAGFSLALIVYLLSLAGQVLKRESSLIFPA